MFAGSMMIVAGVLPCFLMAVLAPRIRADLPFSDSALGLAIAAFYLAGTVSSIPSGWLVERIGPATGIRVAAGCTSLACLAVVFLAHSAAVLTALIVFAGVGNALTGPAVSALLWRDVPANRRGVSFGAQQAGAPVGALLAGLALPAIAMPFGWRAAFAATAALGVGAAAAATGTRPSRGAQSSADQRPGGAVIVVALAGIAALASSAAVGLVSFLVLYALERGFDEADAGLLLASVSFFAAASRIALGAIGDRVSVDPLHLVALMLATSVLGYGLLAVGGPHLIVPGAILAGGAGWAWPGALTIAAIGRSHTDAAWATGIVMGGLYAGAIAGPAAVGLLAERGRFGVAWATCAVLSSTAAIASAAIWRHDAATR